MAPLSAGEAPPLRVCLLEDGPSAGGVAAITGTLVQALQAQGWQVDRHAATLPPTAALLRTARRCDVVLAAHNFRPAYVARLLGCVVRRPVVVWVHGPLDEVLDQAGASRGKRAWLRWFYRRVHHLVFVSQATRAAYARFTGPSGPRQRQHVVPNAAPPGAGPAPFADAGGADMLRLAYVGRLSAEKNPALLIDTLRHLPAASHLAIAGDGPLRGALEHAGADLVQAGRLTFLGHVRADAAFYQRHHLTLLASRYEGCPMAALESLAAGVPCVGVPIASLREMLSPDAPYLLAHTPTAAALAAAVEDTRRRPADTVRADLTAVLRRYTPADFATGWSSALHAAASPGGARC